LTTINQDAEDNNFPLPLRGRQRKRTKQLTLRKQQKTINSLIAKSDTDILLPEGLCHFAFRRLSEKQKRKTKNSAIFAALR
jgi:hypothetical protein